MKKKPELLAPASSLDVFKTALDFGADAVYIGGEEFGLRAKAKNFSDEDMAKAISIRCAASMKMACPTMLSYATKPAWSTSSRPTRW